MSTPTGAFTGHRPPTTIDESEGDGEGVPAIHLHYHPTDDSKVGEVSPKTALHMVPLPLTLDDAAIFRGCHNPPVTPRCTAIFIVITVCNLRI